VVQTTTNLADPSSWSSVDLVQSATGSLRWMSPEALEASKYYRLVLPQPLVFSVEPAIVAPGVAVDFYVLGQCFPTNAALQINGVTQAGAVVVSSSLMTISGFVPDLPGTYQIRLMVGGVGVSAFSVVCADALANPELVMQGPPTMEPPASPSAIWLSKKGYDYYKAQSDLTSAGAMNIPILKTTAWLVI